MNKLKQNQRPSKSLLLYAHPYEKSFSHAMMTTIKEALLDQNKEIVIIDLNVDQFDPIDDHHHLNQYQSLIKEVQELIIIYPVWWGGPPALLEGFFKQVLNQDAFYHVDKTGQSQGQITWIKQAYVYTTSSTPNFIWRLILKSVNKNKIIHGLLKPLGINNIIFKNLGQIGASQERRERFLQKIKKLTMNN